MKKFLLSKSVLVAGIFGLLTSQSANANLDLKFYSGAGIDYSKYGMEKEIANEGVEVKNKGFGLLIPVLGVKFNEYFGVEAGYSFNKKITLKDLDSNPPTKLSLKIKNVYLDLMGFMPVGNQIDLIGGLGIGSLLIKGKDVDGDVDLKLKNTVGLRIKAGAQYNFTNNVALRALLAYQKADNKITYIDYKLVKNMKSIGLSAIYTF